MFCILFIFMVENTVDNSIESKPNIVASSIEFQTIYCLTSVILKPNIVKTFFDVKQNVDFKDNIVGSDVKMSI